MRIQVNYISILFIVFISMGCSKKHIAEDKTIYLGSIDIKDDSNMKIEGEFSADNSNKDYTFSLVNDSVSFEIQLGYDKKTKEITGSVYNVFSEIRYLKGKKVGSDFILGIFIELGNNPLSNIPYQQIGSIYLTPKK